jgi:hypothetical protein
MKLGQKVRFKIDYVKSGEYLDPDNATEEQTENGVILTKFKPREHDSFKEGYICGKRYYTIKTYLDYDVEYYNENTKNRFYSYKQDYETFYLVGTNLAGFHKVLQKDLERVD